MSEDQTPFDNNRRAVRVIRAPSRVIGMHWFDGRIYVACEGGVYLLERDELVPLRFVEPDRGEVRLERPQAFRSIDEVFGSDTASAGRKP